MEFPKFGNLLRSCSISYMAEIITGICSENITILNIENKNLDHNSLWITGIFSSLYLLESSINLE